MTRMPWGNIEGTLQEARKHKIEMRSRDPGPSKCSLKSNTSFHMKAHGDSKQLPKTTSLKRTSRFLIISWKSCRSAAAPGPPCTRVQKVTRKITQVRPWTRDFSSRVPSLGPIIEEMDQADTSIEPLALSHTKKTRNHYV